MSSVEDHDPAGPVDPASLVRQLADLVATGGGSAAEWATLAGAARSMLDGAETGHGTTYARAVADDVAAGADRDTGPAPEHPLGIGASAVFPVIEFRRDGPTLEATFVFGPAFEGPPGLVHGGHLASAFDVVLSAAATNVWPYSVTRSLEVRFLRPTPLGYPLRLVAVASAGERRMVEVQGRLYVGRRATARGSAQCVELSADRYVTRFGRSIPA